MEFALRRYLALRLPVYAIPDSYGVILMIISTVSLIVSMQSRMLSHF